MGSTLAAINRRVFATAPRWQAALVLLAEAMAIGVVDRYMLIRPGVWTAGPVLGMVSKIVLVGILTALTADGKAAASVSLAGAVLLLNQLLLANRYATILNFGELSLVPHLGHVFTRIFLVAAVALALYTALAARRRIWLVLVVVLLVLGSFPGKLPDDFFI